MTTFVLKKYEQFDNNAINTDNTDNKETENKENNIIDELKISVNNSVAEIVAEILYKRLENKVEIEQIEDDENNASDIKAISTEEINSDPLNAFNFIKSNDIVFILNRGFRTRAEEWFLVNLENKTNKVIYTVESFIKFIKSKLGIKE